MTLGGKLIAQEGKLSKTINLLFQYILNMARYDLNYDVRDRARFLRALVYGQQKDGGLDSLEQDSDNIEDESPDHNRNGQGDFMAPSSSSDDQGGFEYSEKELNLSDHVKKILLSEKAAPIQENPSHGKDQPSLMIKCSKISSNEEFGSNIQLFPWVNVLLDLLGREQYTIGSMSLVLNRTVAGYEPLPDWPTVQPDPTVRRMASTLETPGHMNDRTGFGSESFGGQGKGAPSTSSRYDGRSGGFVTGTGGAQSLDKFLESSSSEESDSSEGSSEDSEDDSDEESEGNDSGSGSEDESEDEEEEEESGDSEGDSEASSSEEEAILPPARSNGKRR